MTMKEMSMKKRYKMIKEEIVLLKMERIYQVRYLELNPIKEKVIIKAELTDREN